MQEYVIFKSSRMPARVSYEGPTWDAAGLRAQYQPTYTDLKLAKKLAAKLSEFNPVGFKVDLVPAGSHQTHSE